MFSVFQSSQTFFCAVSGGITASTVFKSLWKRETNLLDKILTATRKRWWSGHCVFWIILKRCVEKKKKKKPRWFIVWINWCFWGGQQLWSGLASWEKFDQNSSGCHFVPWTGCLANLLGQLASGPTVNGRDFFTKERHDPTQLDQQPACLLFFFFFFLGGGGQQVGGGGQEKWGEALPKAGWSRLLTTGNMGEQTSLWIRNRGGGGEHCFQQTAKPVTRWTNSFCQSSVDQINRHTHFHPTQAFDV